MADLISVVVPVYNVAEDLPRCLDSILAQSYLNIELIAVDDGSSDESGTILDKYAQLHPNIHVIHQENGGVTSARLCGAAEASGEWIGFVDGDDEIEPDMYERLLRNALEYGAEISHCGYQMCFPDGRVNYFHNTGKVMEQDKKQGLTDLLDGSVVEPGLCNKLYKKDLFQSIGQQMDSSIRINEDLLMNFLLFACAKKAVFEDFCPYHYIVRQNSVSRQKLNSNKIYDPIRVKEHILRFAPAEVIPVARRAYLSTCINVYNSVMLSDQLELAKDKTAVHNILLDHYEWANLLGKKQRVLAAMIRYVPWLYKPMYRFYNSHIQKNPYE